MLRNTNPAVKQTKLDLRDFRTALRVCNYDADDDETECLLATVIVEVRGGQGATDAVMRRTLPPPRAPLGQQTGVKAQISHQHGKVLFREEEPFPLPHAPR